MKRICTICAAEFTTCTAQAMYCSKRCSRIAETRKARKRRIMRDFVATFAVVTGGLSIHSPNVSAAQAAWECDNVYSQQHPCGVSERN